MNDLMYLIKNRENKLILNIKEYGLLIRYHVHFSMESFARRIMILICSIYNYKLTIG